MSCFGQKQVRASDCLSPMPESARVPGYFYGLASRDTTMSKISFWGFPHLVATHQYLGAWVKQVSVNSRVGFGQHPMRFFA